MEESPCLSRPNLRGAVWALLITFALLVGGSMFARIVERRYIHGLAPKTFEIKNQGEALQSLAFSEPDLLPFYGSSELVKSVPDTAARFFATYPTGFNVFPVGKAGTTPLIMLQKLAAVGEGVRGKKMAISISPSWFFYPTIKPTFYAGNFSTLQADELVFSTKLSLQLRHDAACIMSSFPNTLERSTLLSEAVRRLARFSWSDRLYYRALWPLGRAEIAMMRLEDHIETLHFISKARGKKGGLPTAIPHELRELDWNDLTAEATLEATPEENRHEIPVMDDERFLATMAHAQEWTTLDLLLRGLQELGAEPLLMSMPVDGTYYDLVGVSAEARDTYYDRLSAVAERYHRPVVAFREHENDPKFLVDMKDHLSVEGWMYYNEALDAFFHDRPLSRKGG